MRVYVRVQGRRGWKSNVESRWERERERDRQRDSSSSSSSSSSTSSSFPRRTQEATILYYELSHPLSWPTPSPLPCTPSFSSSLSLSLIPRALEMKPNFYSAATLPLPPPPRLSRSTAPTPSLRPPPAHPSFPVEKSKGVLWG